MKKELLAFAFISLVTLVSAQQASNDSTRTRISGRHEVGINIVQVQRLDFSDNDDVYYVPGVYYRFNFGYFQLRGSLNYTRKSYYLPGTDPNATTPSLYDYRSGKFSSFDLRYGLGAAFVSRKLLSAYVFVEPGLRYTKHVGDYRFAGVDYKDDWETVGVGGCFGPGVSLDLWRRLFVCYEANWAFFLQKTKYYSRGSVTPIYGWTEFFPVSTLGISCSF